MHILDETYLSNLYSNVKKIKQWKVYAIRCLLEAYNNFWAAMGANICREAGTKAIAAP